MAGPIIPILGQNKVETETLFHTLVVKLPLGPNFVDLEQRPAGLVPLVVLRA